MIYVVLDTIHTMMMIVCNFILLFLELSISWTFQKKGKYNDLRQSCNILDPAINAVDETWDTCKKHILDNSNLYRQIEKIQHRFTQMIHGMKGMPYESRFEELGLWTLEERRNRSDLIEVYKITTGLSKLRLETFFKLNYSGIARGHSLKLLKQLSKSEMR